MMLAMRGVVAVAVVLALTAVQAARLDDDNIQDENWHGLLGAGYRGDPGHPVLGGGESGFSPYNPGPEAAGSYAPDPFSAAYGGGALLPPDVLRSYQEASHPVVLPPVVMPPAAEQPPLVYEPLVLDKHTEDNVEATPYMPVSSMHTHLLGDKAVVPLLHSHPYPRVTFHPQPVAAAPPKPAPTPAPTTVCQLCAGTVGCVVNNECKDYNPATCTQNSGTFCDWTAAFVSSAHGSPPPIPHMEVAATGRIGDIMDNADRAIRAVDDQATQMAYKVQASAAQEAKATRDAAEKNIASTKSQATSVMKDLKDSAETTLKKNELAIQAAHMTASTAETEAERLEKQTAEDAIKEAKGIQDDGAQRAFVAKQKASQEIYAMKAAADKVAADAEDKAKRDAFDIDSKAQVNRQNIAADSENNIHEISFAAAAKANKNYGKVEVAAKTVEQISQATAEIAKAVGMRAEEKIAAYTNETSEEIKKVEHKANMEAERDAKEAHDDANAKIKMAEDAAKKAEADAQALEARLAAQANEAAKSAADYEAQQACAEQALKAGKRQSDCEIQQHLASIKADTPVLEGAKDQFEAIKQAAGCRALTAVKGAITAADTARCVHQKASATVEAIGKPDSQVQQAVQQAQQAVQQAAEQAAQEAQQAQQHGASPDEVQQAAQQEEQVVQQAAQQLGEEAGQEAAPQQAQQEAAPQQAAQEEPQAAPQQAAQQQGAPQQAAQHVAAGQQRSAGPTEGQDAAPAMVQQATAESVDDKAIDQEVADTMKGVTNM